MITSATYIEIANLINSVLPKGDKISSIIGEIESVWENSEISSESVDRIEFENYLRSTEEILSKKHIYYPEEMLNFVRDLQKYIEKEYGSVNDFIRDNGIQVREFFADISEYVGYPIDIDNIESVS